MNNRDGLIIVWMDVAKQHDEELHDWYETEHVPEVAALRGVHSVHRAVDPTHPLRYMAMFECQDDGVEHGPDFQHMVRNPTPWTQRIRTLFGDKRLRGNYAKRAEQVFSPSVDNGPAGAWLVVQSDQDPRETRSLAVGPTGCRRYRAYVQCPPDEPFRPSPCFLELFDFGDVAQAEAARLQLDVSATADVSVRHAVGTPILVADDEFARRLQGASRAMEPAREMPKPMNLAGEPHAC